MVTVVFVHGISIREADYKVTFQAIQEILSRRISRFVLTSCLWGDEFGADLRAGGASIPRYQQTKQTKGIEEQLLAVDDLELWELLDDDALLEMRLLSLRPHAPQPEFDPRGSVPPHQLLDERIRFFTPSTHLAKSLEQHGISTATFDSACKHITTNPIYDEALQASTDDLGEFSLVWARAVIALSIGTILDATPLPPDQIEHQMRSKLAAALAGEVGNEPKGIVGDWLKYALSVFGTRLLESRRGHYSDVIVPYIGDLLVYQGNGQPIREKIVKCIRDAGDGADVVLLGHSLGGVACVDLLAQKEFPTVKLVITVGSQAPLFYEMNALQKLRFGERLPNHVPQWLNIYDQRDFLSYIGKQAFKDPLDRIVDVEVDNGRRFPRAHNAYWKNSKMWDVIVPWLLEVLQ